MAVRVGFIGVGGIASTHLETIASTDNAEVSAVYDVDGAAKQRAADHWGATAASDLDDLVSQPDLDAVFVCIPPDARGPPERAVAERGLDLFVEKPAAIQTARAIELNDLLEEAGVLTQVGHVWRYAESFQHGQSLLADRTIGYLDGRFWSSVPGGPGHWWREEARSGGQVIEQAIRVVDTIRYLAGDIETVYAAGGERLVDSIDFPDVSSATMTHFDGTISHVSATSGAIETRIGLEVVARDATISLSESQVVGTVNGNPVDRRFDDDPYAREVVAFVEAVRTRSTTPIRSPYGDAVRSLAVTEAVTCSMRRGEPVEVAEFLGEDHSSNRYSVPVSEDS